VALEELTMTLVTAIAHLLEPWQTAYADSKVLPTVLTGAHLLALLFSGGLALGADRATLRALTHPASTREAHLEELGSVHRPVLVALTVLFASGALLAAADVETFLSSPVFWGKLALVALLLVNGLVMTRTEASLRRLDGIRGIGRDGREGREGTPRLWRRLRACAWASLLLWAATTVVGAALVGAA
jgi:hypothetical protein